ncbi:hypothetical protein COOONC_15345 [Cooperia oncophora]
MSGSERDISLNNRKQALTLSHRGVDLYLRTHTQFSLNLLFQYCCEPILHQKQKTMTREFFYAVAVGRIVGVYTSWDDCRDQIDGYVGARYKKFTNERDAWAWIEAYQKGQFAQSDDYYAVANGRIVGVFRSWDECSQQVAGFPRAKFKKFATEYEALEFIENYKRECKVP